MIKSKIFIRNIRSGTRAVIKKDDVIKKVEGTQMFKPVNVEIDLKKMNNLSAIARFAIESDVDAIKTLNSGKSILNENRKFEMKNYRFDENYLKLRDELLNEISNIDEKIESLISEEVKKVKKEVIEDPNIPPSKIKCSGCGSKFQCNNKNEAGFVSVDKFQVTNKRELMFKFCLRCELLKQKQKRYLNLVTNEEDYKKNVLEKILTRKENLLVILLIDLLDMPNSIYEGWSKLISGNNVNNTKPFDIFIIGSKFDLLPNTGPTWKDDVKNCLLKQCADKGIKGEQIKHVQLISAKKGYDIENLVDKLFDFWQYKGDVFLLGVTNSGKSMLFNRLLSSDYCQALASNALLRATTSYWPNTTLNMLKFPITKLDEIKMSIRQKRLYENRILESKLRLEKYEKFKKTFAIEDAELFGIVDHSFKRSRMPQEPNKIESEFSTAYSYENNKIVEGENLKSPKDIHRIEVAEARENYNPNHNKYSCYFYDTPGVQLKEHIIRYIKSKLNRNL
jgi:hypothetical protein